MAFADQHPEYTIKTTEQATRWLREQIEEAKQVRMTCDVRLPGGPQETRAFQKRQYNKLVMKQFAALGALGALHRVGLFEDEAYMRLRTELTGLLVPAQVGHASDASASGGFGGTP